MPIQRISAVAGRRIANLHASRVLLLSVAPLLLLFIALIAYHLGAVDALLSFSPTELLSPPRIPIPPATANGRSRIAVCLVGGARRFELTGPSIVKNLLRKYPNADLFVNSPFDENSYKFFLLNDAPRIAGVRIFEPGWIEETESQIRVLNPRDSPNGIQVGRSLRISYRYFSSDFLLSLDQLG